MPSVQEPLIYLKANVDGTAAVVEASRQAGVKRLIYTASSSCYGLPDVFPTPESAPIRPMYPYALTKNVGEQYVMHWDNVYGLPTVALRLFNVYGPRSRASGTYGAVFGVFLAQKLAGKPFTVVGDGTQTRDFTFVSDVAEAFVSAALSSASGEVFNVGCGMSTSVNEVVAHLKGILVSEGDIRYGPSRAGDVPQSLADISRAREQLGYEPRVLIGEGLERVALWFRKGG